MCAIGLASVGTEYGPCYCGWLSRFVGLGIVETSDGNSLAEPVAPGEARIGHPAFNPCSIETPEHRQIVILAAHTDSKLSLTQSSGKLALLLGETELDAYEKIEHLIAEKYGKDRTTRKAVGDFMIDESHAVNVKSNNVHKQNYSPNMISIKKMHQWVYEEKRNLSFVFVDYEVMDGELNLLCESDLIPIEHISWDCLSIEAQGYGVIQKIGTLAVDKTQTKRKFYEGFLAGYRKFRLKEENKHNAFSSRFIDDLDSIDW